MGLTPFLRIPPFPGHRAAPLARPGTSAVDPAALAEALRRQRVGGAFWGAQAEPGERFLAPDNPAQLAEMKALGAGSVVVPNCDPWSVAAQAGEVWAGADNELALVAALAGTPVRLFGEGRFSGCERDPAGVAARMVGAWAYACPFAGRDLSPLDAVARLGEWRRLIDANRSLAAVFGVAGWKRVTLDALLWDGSGPVRHARRLPQGLGPHATVAVWKSRTGPSLLAALEASGATLAEIEDGFIRSAGLGANCVPPLSAILDFAGVYFDPATLSDLETILATAEIGPDLLTRAAMLRERLVQAAISKYGQGGARVDPPAGERRRVLVTGQVEDDRSIVSGGAGISNLELLSRARALEGEAWIIYKPHPDVEAGHRKGHVPEAEALRFADQIERAAPITSLIDAVDALHVITSLAGFEALLRGKRVTTHGVPFYAGWGLTHDLGAVPPRRSRARSLDGLVAATLLLYPRYLDPLTRLPCPAEVVVERMASGQARVTSPLVILREWQGRAQALWRRARGGR